eukprot:TRINITY_DN12117_c0_g1_i1.p1 TRINITY_DN12117_c0_g1~~TRINITY_DN12117_c0_g1_i1.p1  ORF type:complete len:154 (-),score=28.13 TRINITY_DN12117_c0_g1_i1:525-986(-)
MARVQSPFIVQLHWAFQTRKEICLVMELIEGGDLLMLLRKKCRFSEETAKFYATEMLVGIECLHKSNFVYRDLKLENVLIDTEGHIKLSDFGLSKEGIAAGKKKSYTICGTLDYVAPEVLKGHGHNKAVDWWSFVSLYLAYLGNNNIRDGRRS